MPPREEARLSSQRALEHLAWEFAASLAFFLLLVATVARADWGPLVQNGTPVAAAATPAAAWLSAARAIVVGLVPSPAVDRLEAWQVESGVWTAIGGGPVDEGLAVQHVGPVLAGDGEGHALLAYTMYGGSAWRVFARRYDGANFSTENNGDPVDAGQPGNAVHPALAYLAPTRALLAYAGYTGSRLAIYACTRIEGVWTPANGGLPVDDPALGSSDDPSIASDGSGGAVVAFTQQVAGVPRLFAVRLSPAGWTRLGTGPLDRADLADVSSPEAVPLGNGGILVTYLQDDANGVTRLYGVAWDGAAWTPLEGGAPLDGSPTGIGALSAAPDGAGGALVTVVSNDEVSGVVPSHAYGFSVNAGTVQTLNGGAALDAAGTVGVAAACASAPFVRPSPAVLLLAGRAGGTNEVYARLLAMPAAAAVPPAGPAPDGVRVVHNVFQPGRGEEARITLTVSRAQNVRSGIYDVTGAAVRTVVAGPLGGELDQAWDGTDGAGRAVGAGLYLLVTTGETFSDTRKLVVIR